MAATAGGQVKFPKHNPFAVPPACWQLRFVVPMEAALAVEEAFDDIAFSTSSFESPGNPFQWQVTILAAAPPLSAEIKSRLEALSSALKTPIPFPTIEEVPQQDWLGSVARDFPPLEIGRFFVHGAHAKALVPQHSLPIQVEAGTAFGSGEHATTRGCLRALDRLARERNARSVLDMGCGSGILAIAAARLWPSANIVAVDSDAVSVRVAQDNIRINRLSRQIHALTGNGYSAKGVKQEGPYDIIVANILARPLVAMSKALSCHLARGGVAVLSGLLIEQAPMVIATHRRQGLHLAGRIHDMGWATLVMEG